MGFAKNRAMELESRGFGDVEGSLCHTHIVDVALSQRLAISAEGFACTFCGRDETGKETEPFAIPVENLLYEVMETIRAFYTDADVALPWDNEDGLTGPQSDTWEVVEDLASGAFEESVSDAVLEMVIEAIGTDTSWTWWSGARDLDDLEYAWEAFAQTARHTSRFVFPTATAASSPPARLARFLESLLVYVEADLDLVTFIPEGSSFYRGRLCDDPKALHRDSRDLGPAPVLKASANRMSPAGISIFYASGDPKTAVAEIAGHGVEPLAVVGKFTSLRPLRVLDLTRKPKDAASPFDEARREQSRMARFLESFVGYMTAPVIPDGRQHIEYAPTQVLTEYLRWVPDPKLDGIVLPSAQTSNPTHVLFFDASAFRTKGDAPPASGGLFGFDGQDQDEDDDGVWFEMDPDEVATYRIRRVYGTEEASSRRAAEPRLIGS